MKSKIFLIIFTLVSMQVMAGGSSMWLTIGARGTFNAPFLINSNEYNDKGIKHNVAFGGSGGAMLGFHFSDVGSINFEALYTTYSRKLKSGIDSVNWTHSTNMAYLQFPILLRAEWNFKYVEAGVALASLSSATQSYKNEKAPALDYSGKDAKDQYIKPNTSIIFGWGTNLMGSGGSMLSLGIRLSYGLTDIVSDLGGKGKIYKPSDGDGTPATDKAYKGTNTATVGIHLSWDFDLGYFASSSCGRKHAFKLFGH